MMLTLIFDGYPVGTALIMDRISIPLPPLGMEKTTLSQMQTIRESRSGERLSNTRSNPWQPVDLARVGGHQSQTSPTPCFSYTLYTLRVSKHNGLLSPLTLYNSTGSQLVNQSDRQTDT